MIEGMLGHDNVERTALIVVCHPEIAYDALDRPDARRDVTLYHDRLRTRR